MRFITIALVLISSAVTSAAWATPISDKYAQLGGAGGFLGQPTIAETSTPDGVGRYRHYEGGSIYWHPRTGAHEVHGLIGQRWAELNWEQGYLGYPITDEINTVDGGGRVSRFEGGELIWREKTNTVREVKASDLVVELPFPPGETWAVTQSHGVEGLSPASHFNRFAYCWDFVRVGGSSGKPFTAVANGRIVHADDSYGSGDGTAIQAMWSCSAWDRAATPRTCTPRPAATRRTSVRGRSSCRRRRHGACRPSASTGAVLATVGDTGTGVGEYHLHFCVTTAPDRPALQAIRVGAGVVP